MGKPKTDSLPLRGRLLVLLRSDQWRSERQLCRAICKRNENTTVQVALLALMREGLVEYHDSSLYRYRLTTAGRVEAKRAWDSYVKGKAA